MLKLIQVEFLKLRRRKFIWLMLLAALFMPLAAVFYFSSVKGTGVDPIMFYKWTAFSYTPWIILPVVLGMLCTMLMYNENQYDMLKQLWIVPVNKMAYFFSKFAVVLVYSICFMLVTATASILTGILSGYIPFDSESVLYLLRKCMEISLLTAFAVLPVLAVAAAQKGYILPVCQNDTCLCVQRSDLPFTFCNYLSCRGSFAFRSTFRWPCVRKSENIFSGWGRRILCNFSYYRSGSADEKGVLAGSGICRNLFVCWIICEYVPAVKDGISHDSRFQYLWLL